MALVERHGFRVGAAAFERIGRDDRLLQRLRRADGGPGRKDKEEEVQEGAGLFHFSMSPIFAFKTIRALRCMETFSPAFS